MQRLDDILKRRARTLSFEFFPPKTERSWFTMEDTIEQLAPLGPDFVSVTYGAGGTTRGKTREVIELIQAKTGIPAMAHLTCVNATRSELAQLLDEYHAAGIRSILALRGDPPKGQTRFTPVDGGCAHASDLIALVRAQGDRFAVACAAFPEKHPDATDRATDWRFLEAKFAAGACVAITQCFYDVADWRAMTAALPGRRIIPGVMPVTGWGQLQKVLTTCAAGCPPTLRALLEPLANDPVAARRAGIAFTIRFCQELIDAGAPGIHLYCMNRSTAAAELTTALRMSGHL